MDCWGLNEVITISMLRSAKYHPSIIPLSEASKTFLSLFSYGGEALSILATLRVSCMQTSVSVVKRSNSHIPWFDQTKVDSNATLQASYAVRISNDNIFILFSDKEARAVSLG